VRECEGREERGLAAGHRLSRPSPQQLWREARLQNQNPISGCSALNVIGQGSLSAVSVSLLDSAVNSEINTTC